MLVNTGGRKRYRLFKNMFVLLEIKSDKCVWGGGGRSAIFTNLLI